MIPNKLEELMFEGKAEFITYATGGSGVATIPFPRGARSMYVIWALWNPFTDIVFNLQQSGGDAATFSNRNIHTLRLVTSKKATYINFRDIVTPTGNPALPNPLQFQNPTLVPLYLYSETDIHVNIFNFGNPALMTGLFDAVPRETQESSGTASGYGGQRAQRSIITDLQAYIVNMGVNRDAAATPTAGFQKANQRNEFYDNINFNTVLNPAFLDVADPANTHLGFPLVTFGVVIVNDFPDAKKR